MIINGNGERGLNIQQAIAAYASVDGVFVLPNEWTYQEVYPHKTDFKDYASTYTDIFPHNILEESIRRKDFALR